MDGVEGQRSGLGVAPNRGLAAVLDDIVLQDPLAVGGHRNRPIPMGAETAHAGGFRLVEDELLGGSRAAGGEKCSQNQ